MKVLCHVQRVCFFMIYLDRAPIFNLGIFYQSPQAAHIIQVSIDRAGITLLAAGAARRLLS